MRIKTGSLITSVKGVIGGHYTQTSNGTISLRTKRSSSNRITSYNSLTSTYFAAVTREWDSLTDTERETWIDVNSTDRSNYLFFIALNVFRLRIGLPIVARRPVKPLFPQLVRPVITFIPAVQSLTLNLTNGTQEQNFKLRIDISSPCKCSALGYARNYFFVGIYDYVISSTIDISTQVINHFGLFRAGTIFFTKLTLIDMDTGYHDTPIIIRVKEYKGMQQHDVTTSRSFRVTYQNLTGKEMYISVTGTVNAGSSIFAKTDNNTSPTTIVAIQSAAIYSWMSLFFIVPVGAYYYLDYNSGATVETWIEWY